jgi:DNA-binding NtrC family response regulator
MPKMNGKVAYEEIKKLRPDVKAVFMSGYTADIVNRQGILETDMEFIVKPFPPNALLRKVREILDNRIS